MKIVSKIIPFLLLFASQVFAEEINFFNHPIDQGNFLEWKCNGHIIKLQRSDKDIYYTRIIRSNLEAVTAQLSMTEISSLTEDTWLFSNGIMTIILSKKSGRDEFSMRSIEIKKPFSFECKDDG